MPTRVKIFLWLAALDRFWTTARLARHHLPHADSCLFCDQDTKCIQHILARCSFSRQVWFDILAWCRRTVTIPSKDAPFPDWLASSATGVPSCLRHGFTSLALLISRWIWKQHNAYVFDAA